MRKRKAGKPTYYEGTLHAFIKAGAVQLRHYGDDTLYCDRTGFHWLLVRDGLRKDGPCDCAKRWQVDAAPLLKNPDPAATVEHYCVYARRPTEGGRTEERRWGAFIQKERAEEIAADVRKALEGRESCSVGEIDTLVIVAIGP